MTAGPKQPPAAALVPRDCPDFLSGVQEQLAMAGLQLRVLDGLQATVGPLAARITRMADRELRQVLQVTSADPEAAAAVVAASADERGWGLRRNSNHDAPRRSSWSWAGSPNFAALAAGGRSGVDLLSFPCHALLSICPLLPQRYSKCSYFGCH